MVLRVTSLSSLILGCTAHDAEFLLAGPDVMWEFEMDNKAKPGEIKFYPFSDSYVQKALSEGVDWTKDKRGVVTEVKNQGPHPYCGTFTRIAIAEGQYALHSGHDGRSLSVQQMIDCVGHATSQMPSILAQAGSQTPGLMSWADYPYDIKKYQHANPPPVPGHPCHFRASMVVPDYGKDIIGYTTPKHQSEDQAAAFVHHNGPIGCGINSNIFKSMDSEHFVTRQACEAWAREPDHTGIDHSVSCVGFGVHPKKGPYWKVRNSWGNEWADHGFARIYRGIGCGNTGSSYGPVPVYHDILRYYPNYIQPLPTLPPLPCTAGSCEGSCEDRCRQKGHCCTGDMSTSGSPSCVMGCALAALEVHPYFCRNKCDRASDTCSWTFNGRRMMNCEDCPSGCKSDGVQDCYDGCDYYVDTVNSSSTVV